MLALLPMTKFTECVTEVTDSWTKNQGVYGRHNMCNLK